jgi:hypothetical protein
MLGRLLQVLMRPVGQLSVLLKLLAFCREVSDQQAWLLKTCMCWTSQTWSGPGGIGALQPQQEKQQQQQLGCCLCFAVRLCMGSPSVCKPACLLPYTSACFKPNKLAAGTQQLVQSPCSG